jgi:hypothetical protein
MLFPLGVLFFLFVFFFFFFFFPLCKKPGATAGQPPFGLHCRTQQASPAPAALSRKKHGLSHRFLAFFFFFFFKKRQKSHRLKRSSYVVFYLLLFSINKGNKLGWRKLAKPERKKEKKKKEKKKKKKNPTKQSVNNPDSWCIGQNNSIQSETIKK